MCSEQLIEIASSTGIVLDPTYTLKGVQGLLGELEKNPTRFKGNRILHIHTGRCTYFSVIVLYIHYIYIYRWNFWLVRWKNY